MVLPSDDGYQFIIHLPCFYTSIVLNWGSLDLKELVRLSPTLRVFEPWTTTPPVGGSAVIGQVTAPSPPGFQLGCCLLCQSQQEDLSNTSPNLWTRDLSVQLLSDSIAFKLGTHDSPHPSSAATSSTPCLNISGRTVGTLFSSSLPSSLGTVSYRKALFLFGDHRTLSGLIVVDSTASGKWSFLPRLTSIWYNWATAGAFAWYGSGWQVYDLSQRWSINIKFIAKQVCTYEEFDLVWLVENIRVWWWSLGCGLVLAKCFIRLSRSRIFSFYGSHDLIV